MDRCVQILFAEFPDEFKSILQRMSVLREDFIHLSEKVEQRAIHAFTDREFERIGGLSDCAKNLEKICGNIDHCLSTLGQAPPERAEPKPPFLPAQRNSYGKNLEERNAAIQKDVISSLTITCKKQGVVGSDGVTSQQIAVFRSGLVRQRIYRADSTRAKSYRYSAPGDEVRALLTLFSSALIHAYVEPVGEGENGCRWTIMLSFLNRSGRKYIHGKQMPPNGGHIEKIICSFADYAEQPWIFRAE